MSMAVFQYNCLWTLKSKFCRIFMCHEILLSFWFFSQSVKNVKTTVTLCVCAVAQSCPILCSSLPGSSVHEVFQARILEWVAISYSRASSWPSNWPSKCLCISCIGRQILYRCTIWEDTWPRHLISPIPWQF